MASLLLQAPLGLPQAGVINSLAKALQIPLQYEGLSWEQIQHPQYKQNNPQGSLTVLKVDQENTITEFNTILRYFARLAQSQGIYGANISEQAQIDSILDYSQVEIQPTVFALVAPILGNLPFNQQIYEQAKQDIVRKLQYIEDKLVFRTYLCSNKLSIADAALFAQLFNLFRYIVGTQLRQQFPNLSRWFENIAQLPLFVQNLGKYYPITEEWTSEGQTLVSGLPQVESQQQEPKQKQKGGKQQQQDGERQLGRKELKKAQKAAEKAAKQAAEGGEQPKQQQKQEKKVEQKQEKKPEPAEPATQQAKPKLDFMAFKTEITNTQDKKAAIEQMLTQFEPEHFSLWYVIYDKYGDEGKVLFKTSNLKDSFLQRLDSFRKQSYGVLGVYGDEGDYDIQGCWMWQGSEIPAGTKDVPSFEYYQWKRLDINKPEDKQLLFDSWTGLEESKSVLKNKVLQDLSLFK